VRHAQPIALVVIRVRQRPLHPTHRAGALGKIAEVIERVGLAFATSHFLAVIVELVDAETRRQRQTTQIEVVGDVPGIGVVGEVLEGEAVVGASRRAQYEHASFPWRHAPACVSRPLLPCMLGKLLHKLIVQMINLIAIVLKFFRRHNVHPVDEFNEDALPKF
jgi:hypothetical protein